MFTESGGNAAMQNKMAFLVGLIGGILMISVNAIGGIGLWAYLPLIIGFLGLPSEIAYGIAILLSVLYWIAGFGGFSVIFGCILFLVNRIGTGRFIIGLGAGMGLITMILLFVGYFLAGIAPVTWIWILLGSPGLLGAVLSVFGRYLAKPKAQP